MAYNVRLKKEESLEQLRTLVEAFERDIKTFKSITYNETQLRNDFLDPFLMSFGWDVNNESEKTQFLRDVIQEESIEVEGSKKNPDYTLRIQGLRKMFFEAKKPSVNISSSAKAAYQVRRYGWNANLGISILCNFHQLIIYDCRHKPNAGDNERVARIRVFSYEDYIECFDDLYDLISFQGVVSGRLDAKYSIDDSRATETFDKYFLHQIESWRGELANTAIQKNYDLKNNEINFLIQRLLNRIIFLRICEDRMIEKYETLRKVENYEQLKKLFQEADKKYNSGLFNFIDDNLSLTIELDPDVLIKIFNELYYPMSPYDFSIVDPAILSQIYEKYLGSYIYVDEERHWSIVQEPEVVASNGVVSTPKMVVEKIVNETLEPLVIEKDSIELTQLKIADICCGSGTFLLTAYDFLLKKTIETMLEDEIVDPSLIYKDANNTWGLTLKAKRQILENNIFGVDINPYAVEVTEFSLLLKLLEEENEASTRHYMEQYNAQLLPNLEENIKCGNSLVDENFFSFMPEAVEDDNLHFKVKPFNWFDEFPFLDEVGGFDAILGNPPYVRIQNLVKYSLEEIKYYQDKTYGYSVAKKGTIDKYYIFIQRSLSLLNQQGFLGYIVPNKFMIIKGGKELRSVITESSNISKIIHFGVNQVFQGHSTYTAILILEKNEKEIFDFQRVKHITPQEFSVNNEYIQYNQSSFSVSPWVFLTPTTESLFNKLASQATLPLKSLSDIAVGLQTSADKIFIFYPEEDTGSTYRFMNGGVVVEIEKDICLPCIYDLSFEAFDTVAPNAQIIFPYSIEEDKATLLSEEVLELEFPRCWTYLSRYKDQLAKRNLQGANPKWYQFGRSQSLTRFHNTEKLIWSVLSTGIPYAYDITNSQFTGGGNGPYYSLINNSEYSLLYIMGILSHPIIELMVKAGASEFRGSYYSHGKQFIENLPVRIIDFNNEPEVEQYNTIVRSVKGLIETKKRYSIVFGKDRAVLNRKISMHEKTLIQTVNDLYDISQAEFQMVLNDEMFKNELMIEE